ncbi:MAG: hypothetical protein ABJN69_07190 [Hellea sp.]
MILFLPPAPHTGAFFDGIRNALSDLNTEAATYPGYGDVPRGIASIEAYAASLLPKDADTIIVGFHTGCLVAVEMALQSQKTGPLILVDVPYFGDEIKTKYAAGLDDNNPEQDAFRAAFAYDTKRALKRLSHELILVATESNLFEPTVKASKEIKGSRLLERRDISKPAFESAAMAELIRTLAV